MLKVLWRKKSGDRIVVEAGPVGLGIYVPLSVLEVLPPLGEEVKIYTYLQVREDDLSLYGFEPPGFGHVQATDRSERNRA